MLSPFRSDEAEANYRKQQGELWEQALSWRNLKRNLFLNDDLATERELRQLETHFHFLSAYTHPNSMRAWQELFGGNYPSAAGDYDHFASELVLLYVCQIGINELRSFKQMTSRPPSVGLRRWAEIAAVSDDAEARSAHLWFIWHHPSAFDWFSEANRQHFLAFRRSPGVRIAVTPESLAEDEVPYYQHPLRRLRDMHRATRELTTGFGYQPNWR